MASFFRPSRGSRALPSVLALAVTGGVLLLGATPAAAEPGPPPGPTAITVNGDPGTAQVPVDRTTQVMFACSSYAGQAAVGATVTDGDFVTTAEFDADVLQKWFADFTPVLGQTSVRVACEYPEVADVVVDQPIVTTKRGSLVTAGLEGQVGPVEAPAGSVVRRSVTVIPEREFGFRERTPSGTVEFFVDGVSAGAPAPLDAHGVATADIVAPPTGGTYWITVRYSGDVAFLGLAPDFADTLTVPEVVAPVLAPTTITTTSALKQAVATPLTLKATVTAPGSHPRGALTVDEGSTRLSKVDLDEDGTVSLPVGVLSYGKHVLTLSYAGDKHHAPSTATVTVDVSAEPARATDKPNVGVALDTPTPAVLVGGTVTLLGDDFDPGESVVFFLHSDPVYLGTVVADAQGRARLVVALPAGVPTGPHTAIATGATSGRWATTAVTVSAPTAVTPPAAVPAAVVAPTTLATGTATLAATGVQPVGVATGALALVLAGMALVVWVRRSSVTEPDQD